MASTNSDSDILHRFFFFSVLKDGQIHHHFPPASQIPAADDPFTGVHIKDVQISPEVSARLFLPPSTTTIAVKLPVLFYIHGGGYCLQSAFSPEYTSLLTRLVAEANILAVSVEYGLFPSRAIPACYDDSWEALQWVAAHSGGCGSDSWLNRHADFDRLFISGDSAGGNISHALALRGGSLGLPGGVRLRGMILIHPHFLEGDKMWMYMCPENQGPRDRRLMPPAEDLAAIGCEKVMVVVAEKDHLRGGGERYAAELVKCGWKGRVEFVENKGKEHCFHLHYPDDEEAAANQRRIISFIYQNLQG